MPGLIISRTIHEETPLNSHSARVEEVAVFARDGYLSAKAVPSNQKPTLTIDLITFARGVMQNDISNLQHL